MGRITTGIGLVSGINSKDIIDQLMSLEARPKDLLKTRLDQANQQKLAYTDLTTRLTALKLSATTLKKTTTFQQASAKSSNENIISATAAAGAAAGSFQFQVARMVTAQQSVTNGLASTSTKVGAGTITVELGGGEVYSQTVLSQLNGGKGVRSGAFRITDRSGKSAVIDISGAFTLDDVIKKINTSLDIAVKAQIVNDKLTLTDLSGQTTNNLAVTDLGGGTTAADLGIAGNSTTDTLEGATINYLGRSTLLSQLNDGLGVRTAGSVPDFSINAADGSTFQISLSGLNTVGEVLDAINTATDGKVVASIPADGKGITLTDKTAGGTFSVNALNGSRAARDLGIEQVAAADQIDGAPLIASLNTVLLASLRGGQGLDLGKISITNRSGASADVDFTGAATVQDILDRINASGIAVTAKLKESGNGIQIIDQSNGTGDLVIGDVDSTTAAELGIAGTFKPATTAIRGANLQRRWVNETTQLSAYNGGKGVSLGKFRITNSASISKEIDLTAGTYNTLDDVIKLINSKALGVTASINANGDGLLLTDTAGGGGKLKVEDVTGRSAADLNILGTATDTTIDGSFEKTITLTAADTLSTALDSINAPGFAVAAMLVNDGSGATPYRVSLSARNTGRNGRFIFDGGATALQASTLVDAQDAVVFYGGSAGQQPVTITSSTNHLTNVIKGLTIDLNGVSNSPVTVNVSQNVDNVVAELKKFADNFNGLIDKLKDLTKFDSATKTRGILLGESTAQQVQERIYTFFQTSIKDAGTYKMLSEVGLTVGEGSKVEFNEEKFRAAYTASPDSVNKLFTTFQKGDGTTPAKKGIATFIEDQITGLTDPVNGAITRQNQALDQRAQQFQDRMDQLDKLLESKRTRLERQFSSMETVLANLQSQQQSLNSLTGLSATSSSRSK